MTFEDEGPTKTVVSRKRRFKGRGQSIVGNKTATLVVTILPAVVLIIVFHFLPAIQGIRISFSNWHGFGPVDFTGFGNYKKVFTDTPFVSSLITTSIYALLSAAGIIILATILSSAVSGRVWGSAFYRVVWFLPGIAPIAAGGVFWAIAFQPKFGVVNSILGFFGLGDDHAWIASSDVAIYPVIFVTIWAGTGFAFLLILSAMEQVPVSILEAAKMDGAGTIRRFFSVTLPMVRPTIVVTSILELIWHFNGFTVIWAMTHGGPGYETSVLPVLVYREAFEQLDYGTASAIAVIGGVILIVVGLFALKLSRSQQEES